MDSVPQLFLNSKLARHFDGRHPWVLSRSVIEPTSAIQAGQIVELVQPSGGWIGRGVYNPHSRIRVRLYQWERSPSLDTDWVCQQLAHATQMRAAWQATHETLDALRLVNSEGDGLSGLIVDKFGDYLVVQITSLAMFEWRDAIVNWLVEAFHPRGICMRIDASTASNEGLTAFDDWIHGAAPNGPLQISENGVLLSLNLVQGQKTGYYLDQRANRRRAATWIAEGPMLDVCCYHGGFSLAAHKWGNPQHIVAVDSSQPALDQARANAQANGCSSIDFVREDCFDYLQQLVGQEQRFQTVVLDPPRMANHAKQVSAALRAYHRLNLSAVQLLNPGGLLVTCSCSGRVKRDDLAGVVASVAKRTRRRIQILESCGADFDHPIDANCPESDYLKCLICRVL